MLGPVEGAPAGRHGGGAPAAARGCRGQGAGRFLFLDGLGRQRRRVRRRVPAERHMGRALRVLRMVLEAGLHPRADRSGRPGGTRRQTGRQRERSHCCWSAAQRGPRRAGRVVAGCCSLATGVWSEGKRRGAPKKNGPPARIAYEASEAGRRRLRCCHSPVPARRLPSIFVQRSAASHRQSPIGRGTDTHAHPPLRTFCATHTHKQKHTCSDTNTSD